MKQLSLSSFVCVLAFVASAQPEQPAIKLTGIINLPNFKRVLLEVSMPVGSWKQSERLMLAEGQRDATSTKVEVLKIDPEKMLVTVRQAGKEIPVTFDKDESANVSTKVSRLTVLLRNAELAQTLDIYGELKHRTILRPPNLAAQTVSFSTQAPTAAEASKALEAAILERGIAVIPDGDKFVMLVPAFMAKGVTSGAAEARKEHAPDLAGKPNDIIPTGSIIFSPCDVNQVLPIYGELIGRKYKPDRAGSFGLIYFRNTVPLTKDELIYALNTLLAWNNVALVFNDDKTFTAVSAASPRPILPKRDKSN